MINKNNIPEDKQFRELLQDSKLTASENLRYRIMHQIEVEKTLTPKKIKSEKGVVKSLLSIAGVMYFIIVAIAFGTYLTGGIESLLSTDFLLFIAGTTSISAVYALVVVLDERRYKS